MIVRPHPTAFEMLFSCPGSLLPAIMWQIFLAAALGAVAALLRVELESSWVLRNLHPPTFIFRGGSTSDSGYADAI
jgi:predicted membrane chloride channel (bestrophin family)